MNSFISPFRKSFRALILSDGLHFFHENINLPDTTDSHEEVIAIHLPADRNNTGTEPDLSDRAALSHPRLSSQCADFLRTADDAAFVRYRYQFTHLYSQSKPCGERRIFGRLPL